MDDVASVHSENENLRKIRARVLKWDSTDNPLATLTTKQEECVETLTNIWAAKFDVVCHLFQLCKSLTYI